MTSSQDGDNDAVVEFAARISAEMAETHDKANLALFAILARRPELVEGVAFFDTHCPLCGRQHTEENMPYRLGSLDTVITDLDDRVVGWYCDECSDIASLVVG